MADDSRMKATHQGSVELNFVSDQGVDTALNLLRVLYVPGLQTTLFSIESFVSSGGFEARYTKGKVCLCFSPEITFTIMLPHVPPATYVVRSASEIPDIVEHGFPTGLSSSIVRNEEGIQSVLNDEAGYYAAMAVEEGNNNSD